MSRLSFADLSFGEDSAPLYLAAARAVEFQQGGAVLFGAGYDGTTSFRPGTRFGPDAIRRVSDGLETYSPAQHADLEDAPILDAGNLDLPFGAPEPAVEKVGRAVSEILSHGARPLMLGGEHSLTAGAVRGALEHHPDLVVIQLDAHADLRDDYLGEKLSHACAMRRCLDLLDEQDEQDKSATPRLLQVGVRSGTRAEFEELRHSGRYTLPEGVVLAERIAEFGQRPVYLTVDLDIFDPAYFPGTGTPEPGGINWHEFEQMLAALGRLNLIGCDVMELAPGLDPTDVSSVLAAKVVRELLLAMRRDSLAR